MGSTVQYCSKVGTRSPLQRSLPRYGTSSHAHSSAPSRAGETRSGNGVRSIGPSSTCAASAVRVAAKSDGQSSPCSLALQPLSLFPGVTRAKALDLSRALSLRLCEPTVLRVSSDYQRHGESRTLSPQPKMANDGKPRQDDGGEGLEPLELGQGASACAKSRAHARH